MGAPEMSMTENSFHSQLIEAINVYYSIAHCIVVTDIH